MLKQVNQTIKKHQLIDYGDRIIVAVSGGPDSVCLLHALWSLKNEYDLKLAVVHLDHQYRGEASRMDAEYVEEFGRKLGVEVFVFSENIEAYAKQEGLGFEEAARKRRYELFFEAMERFNGTKVAVAHNRNDQVETILMRIMRGTGIDGMQGIPYKRSDGIIRPLLDVDRVDIEAYCDFHMLEPRIDHTNAESVYTRNRIRLELIPYIENHFNMNFQSTLLRNLETIHGDVDYLEKQTELALDEVILTMEGDKWFVKHGLFIEKHSALQRRMLRMLVTRVTGGRYDLSFKQVQSILNMIYKGKTGKVRVLSDGLKFEMSYDLIIVSLNENGCVPDQWSYEIHGDDFVTIPEAGIRIRARVSECISDDFVKKDKKRQIVIDAAKVNGVLTIRNRRSGDRFRPLGMKGSKKVKDYFIDLKVNRDLRNHLPILCDCSNIIWVLGYQMSDVYRITNKTKSFLIIETESIE